MDTILEVVNRHVVDPYILHVVTPVDVDFSVGRKIIVCWLLLYFGSMVLYFTFCSLTYYLYYVRENKAYWQFDGIQIRQEILTSFWSSFLMAGLTAPIEVAVTLGYGRVYPNISDYGYVYLVFSVILFVMFTDSVIYWIHRILHHRWFYPFHKLHHRYKQTTPYSAFSFHPLDGFLQGLPYHMFVFIFPMHRILYLVALTTVGLWTMNIHDRVPFHWYGVNGAAHHTVHHTKFNFNYGQYFTFWDIICGTYLDPMTIEPYKQSEDKSFVQVHRASKNKRKEKNIQKCLK